MSDEMTAASTATTKLSLEIRVKAVVFGASRTHIPNKISVVWQKGKPSFSGG